MESQGDKKDFLKKKKGRSHGDQLCERETLQTESIILGSRKVLTQTYAKIHFWFRFRLKVVLSLQRNLGLSVTLRSEEAYVVVSELGTYL